MAEIMNIKETSITIIYLEDIKSKKRALSAIMDNKEIQTINAKTLAREENDATKKRLTQMNEKILKTHNIDK